ncbi:hypothetical protein KS4_08300 [Poriferisphaera corsica]|uniref:Uncharacterized protein n=1 Tax=Poriferisphaera corsica TaxID=2528020 RepID=A0A517YRE8_9BACT|nr:hypothetical protein [Poriferisphaera corsica]QDU32794.1 hypothetical protein KS4_08300 [Poriferisphaera corsica]
MILNASAKLLAMVAFLLASIAHAADLTVTIPGHTDLADIWSYQLPFSEPYRTYDLSTEFKAFTVDQNKITAQLPDGKYALVFNRVTEDSILSVRTPLLTPSRQTRSENIPLKTKQVSLTLNAPANFTVESLVLRAHDDGKQIRWIRPSHASPTTLPTLTVSPKIKYQLIINATYNNTPLIYYTQLSQIRNGTLVIQTSKLNRITITLDPETPPHTEATLNLNLMDQIRTLNFNDPVVVYTNRRYLEATYNLKISNQNTITFGVKSIFASRNTNLTLGGPLKPHAWVEAMKKKHKGKYIYPIYQQLIVRDKSGLILNPADLQLSGIQYEVGSKTGKLNLPSTEVQPDHWPNEKFVRQFACAVKTTTNLFPDAVIPIEKINTYRTRHFEIHVPACVATLARMYMAKAEVAYTHSKPITDYPGSGNIRIYLITNKSGAKGGWRGKRKGKKNGHISMPEKHFLLNRDYQSRINHLQHEILHTYGHGHGNPADQAAFKIIEDQSINHWKAYAKTAVLDPNFIPKLQRR